MMATSNRSAGSLVRLTLCALVALVLCVPAAAQVTPAAASTPPDDTPTLKVGGVIFADYTYTSSPESPGTSSNDGKAYNPSSFNISRGYINVTGNINHLWSYRITPDVKQETKETSSTSSLGGQYVFRLKFAYAQVNMDDWLPKGSWVRLGMQGTPYIDYADTIYRYRFQGKGMPDRDGFLSSADAGLSARFAFPKNYGDVQVGYYNGEGYETPELNAQKATEIRFSVRPAPQTPVVKGLRFAGFFLSDAPVSGGKRDRMIANLSFEHERVNAAFEYLDAKDRATSSATENHSKGWSAWVTPKFGKGWEAVLRHDDIQLPAQGADARNKRNIAGVAYWFPVQKGVAATILLDYDATKYESYTTAKADDKKYALHALFTF
jgi:hypothetical protein